MNVKSKATSVSWRSYGDLALFTYRTGLFGVGKVTDEIAVQLKDEVYEIVTRGTREDRRILPNHLQVHNYLTRYAEEIGLPRVNFSPVVSNLKPKGWNA